MRVGRGAGAAVREELGGSLGGCGEGVWASAVRVGGYPGVCLGPLRAGGRGGPRHRTGYSLTLPALDQSRWPHPLRLSLRSAFDAGLGALTNRTTATGTT